VEWFERGETKGKEVSSPWLHYCGDPEKAFLCEDCNEGVRLPDISVLFVDLHYHGNTHVKC